MTAAEAKARVLEIRAEVALHDDEAAHSREDSLRADVLRAIAGLNGGLTARQMRELARIALSTERIEFSRWCA